MSKYSVKITGVNTNEIPTLNKEEMLKLFNDFHNGSKEAKEKLIYSNLKLVLSILRRYNSQKYNLDDLFQMGVIGLTKAVIGFDTSYNTLFSTYAVPMISGEIKRYIRDNNALRISRSIKELAYKIILYQDEYLKKYGYEPSIKEITNEFKISDYEVYEALASLNSPKSLEEPIYNDGGDTIYLQDEIKDQKQDGNKKDKLLALKEALLKLDNRTRNIIIKRYISGYTQEEIGLSLNMSQAQVSRIEKKGINEIKRLVK